MVIGDGEVSGTLRERPGGNDTLQQKYDDLLRQNKDLRERFKKQHRIASYYRENPALNRFLRFARCCHDLAPDLKAEAYSSYSVEAQPATNAVSGAVGGQVYCDVVETPSFAERSIKSLWHPTNLSLIDHAFDAYLRRADGLLTVGWTLADKIRHYGPPVTVVPNYRYAQDLVRSGRLRSLCGLAASDRLLLSIGTITGGLEPVLEALTHLPERWHLAMLGEIRPETYENEMREAVSRYGLDARVHTLGMVPYEELTATASGADLGLIILDPGIGNHQVALPNRLFDLMAAGLPVVGPDIPDIARIVQQHDVGITLPEWHAQAWAGAILLAYDRTDELSAKIATVAKSMTWESLGDRVHAGYQHAESITFIGHANLTRNNRTLRLARTLAERGVRVTICCPHAEPDSVCEMEGVRFVLTPPS